MEDYDWTGRGGDLQDSPVVPPTEILQAVEEVHVVPLLDGEEDDNKLSTSHHAYDMSDLWPYKTKGNTAILTVVAPESFSIEDKVGPDTVVDFGRSISTSTNVTVENQEDKQPSASMPKLLLQNPPYRLRLCYRCCFTTIFNPPQLGWSRGAQKYREKKTLFLIPSRHFFPGQLIVTLRLYVCYD